MPQNFDSSETPEQHLARRKSEMQQERADKAVSANERAQQKAAALLAAWAKVGLLLAKVKRYNASAGEHTIDIQQLTPPSAGGMVTVAGQVTLVAGECRLSLSTLGHKITVKEIDGPPSTTQFGGIKGEEYATDAFDDAVTDKIVKTLIEASLSSPEK